MRGVVAQRTIMNPVAPQADVFISYCREDKERVLELAAKIRAAGVSLWIDQAGDGNQGAGGRIVRVEIASTYLTQHQGHIAR